MIQKSGVAIVGVGNTPYLRAHNDGLETLVIRAGRLAIEEAGLSPKDIDGIVTPTAMPPADEIAVGCGITQRRYTGISAYTPGAGATASLLEAKLAIEAGLAQTVLVLYGIKTSTPGGPYAFHAEDSLKADLEMPVGYYGQPLYFGALGQRYKYLYGLEPEELGSIAVSQRQWAQRTPGAQKSKALSMRDYLDAPTLASPLKALDCCLISDGAGACVVTTVERARDLAKPPAVISGITVGSNPWTLTEMFTQGPEFLELGPGADGKAALQQAGITTKDVDVLQIYDCFTLSVILQLESLGFCEPGEGRHLVANGNTGPGGDLPVNTDGGHLCNGYIPGITHVLEGVRQIRGERSEAQVMNANVSLVSTFGGPDHATLVLTKE